MNDSVRSALTTLLTELLDGLPSPPGFVLNPGDPGLLRTLDRLSAEAASAPGPNGGPSVAAHVDHLRYGLHLLNQWADGGTPFDDAEYAASWRKSVVTDVDWTSLLAALRQEAGQWRTAIARRSAGDEIIVPISSVVHLAYHFGAIRQIDRGLAGPSASD